MYHSNLFTIFIPKIFPQVFIGISTFNTNLKMSKITTIIASIVCSVFSRVIPKKFLLLRKSIKFDENLLIQKTSLIENRMM